MITTKTAMPKGGRERRFALIAGLAIGALALDSILISPLLARRSDAETRLGDATRDMNTAISTLNNDRRAAERWKETAGESLQADGPAAESQLLGSVQTWARRSGLNLTSIKVERREVEKGYGKITLRAAATGNLEQLGRFLFAVQQARVPVRVADLTVTTQRDGTDELNVQMGLSTIHALPEVPAGGAR